MRQLVMMNSSRSCQFLVALGVFSLASCAGMRPTVLSPISTREILLTLEAGKKLASMENVPFETGAAAGIVITVHPDSMKQTIDGIGTSFTESSAFVLAHLEPETSRELMQQIYGESGANLTPGSDKSV
jgi:hypothetical protein